MSSKSKWITVSIISVAAILIGLQFNFKPASQPDTSSTQNESNPDTLLDAAHKSPVNGQYVDYSPQIIDLTPGTKILFFHAPWCPQCRALESSLKAQTIPSGVTIIKVDYDSNQPLRQKFGVTIQTTLIKISDSGELIKKYVAYDSPTLESVINNLLK